MMPPALPGPLIALHPVSSAGQILLEVAVAVVIAALVGSRPLAELLAAHITG